MSIAIKMRLLIALALSVGMTSCQPAWAIEIPQRAKAYKRHLIGELQHVWGLGGREFVAIHAAQIHQESLWKPKAESKYARGLTQFTPGTEGDMRRWYPELARGNALDPHWAIRAQVRYMRRLKLAIKPYETELDACSHWAMATAAYNGGLGWINRDRKLAKAADSNPDVWWDSVENYTNRAAWAKTENRGYPRRILLTLTPIYLNAGYGGEDLCDHI